MSIDSVAWTSREVGGADRRYYLAVAKRDDLKLITEDGALKDAAKHRDVPVGSIADL